MSYFTGKNLARKIKEYGFEPFEELLNGFEESGFWQTMEITIDGEALESARIVVYSMLHARGLKEEFSVKMVPARRVLEIKQKINTKIRAAFSFAGTQSEIFEPEEKTSYDPEMKKRIFDDSDVL